MNLIEESLTSWIKGPVRGESNISNISDGNPRCRIGHEPWFSGPRYRDRTRPDPLWSAGGTGGIRAALPAALCSPADRAGRALAGRGLRLQAPGRDRREQGRG